MLQLARWQSLAVFFATLLLLSLAPRATAQNKVMGEVEFDGASKVEKKSGVWIDGQYVGFLEELKGDKKIMLLPGEHEVSVRQSGYQSFDQKIVVEPGQKQTLRVAMAKDRTAKYSEETATLKLNVDPDRAAVFLDGKFVGPAKEFGGRFHSMLVSPGKHHLKIELPGYRTFETEVNVIAGQKAEIKTELIKGSIEQAGPLIKKPD